VARDLGVPAETLRRHVRRLEADEGLRPDVPTSAEREEIRALREEVYELRRANEILEAASVLSEWVALPGRGAAGVRSVLVGVRSADALRYLGARLPGRRAGDVMVDWSIRVGRLRPLDVLRVAAIGREPFRPRELAGGMLGHRAGDGLAEIERCWSAGVDGRERFAPEPAQGVIGAPRELAGDRQRRARV
jgi:hypothetical protein